MDLGVFQNIVKQAAIALRSDADLFDLINPTLPELPPGVDYVSLRSFGLRQLAHGQLTLIAVDRNPTESLIAAFPPIEIVRSETLQPSARPRDSLSAVERKLSKCHDIFPINFNVFFNSKTEVEIERHAVNLVWCYRPLPETMPWLRSILITILLHDEARLYETGDTNLPDGIRTIDDTLNADGSRSANVHWNPMEYDEWLRHFCAVDADWPALVGGE